MKPCPWCKQTPDCVREFGVQIGNSFNVICRCGAHGPTAATNAEAIAFWDYLPKEAEIDDDPAAIGTPAAFMTALHKLGEAIERIQLGRLPESCDAMNAASMAETLYFRIKQQELCGCAQAAAPTAQAIEDEQWGNGQ